MPLSRRQVLFRRRILIFGGLLAVLASGFYLPMTLLAPLSEATAQLQPYDVPVQHEPELAWPEYGASAIGAVDFPGTLAASGSDEALPIASITKIIVALVVLEKMPLGPDEAGPSIAFDSDDVRLYKKYVALNGKVEAVSSGTVLSQRQLLDVVLVESANNYSESLVNWAFGSEANFLGAARTWLDAHGLSATSLSDCTGMSPNNRSTSRDLVELGKLALANPLLSEIVATKSESLPFVGDIRNSNSLLGSDGIRGIKTGTLDGAGACLLFAADLVIGGETITVVGVVLGAVDHSTLNAHIRKLLKTVDDGFAEVTLVAKGDSFGTYSTRWGDRADAVASSSQSVVVWAGTPVSLLVQTEPLRLAPAGTQVGQLLFGVGEHTITVPLELDRAIEDPGPWWRLTHPVELF